MRTPIAILLLLIIWTNSFSQDGSDIRYFKVQGVDSTLIGKDVHFDFFNRSFGGLTIDTVKINIDNRPLKFMEVRRDNGFNNWFSEQILESIDKVEGFTVRISKFKLDNYTSTSFQVTMYLDFYDANNKLFANKSRQIEHWFNKEEITEVLVKAN